MDDPKHLLDLATEWFDPPERLGDVRARFHRRQRGRRVVAVMVALVVAGAGVAFAATQSSNRPKQSMGNPARATCPAEPPSTTITITTLPTKTQFDSGCYAGVANQPLTVVFVNQTTTLSGRSMWLSISVYPSRASADTVSSDGGEVSVNRANAIATSSEVSSGSQAEFTLPALPAGTYWIQSDDVAPIMHAQLVAS